MSKIKLNIAIEIKWDNRYSDTMENDKQGRWARVANVGKNVGKFTNTNIPGPNPNNWQIAWVKKCRGKFIVHTFFPVLTVGIFDTVDQAKAAVEKDFRWFIEMCINN